MSADAPIPPPAGPDERGDDADEARDLPEGDEVAVPFGDGEDAIGPQWDADDPRRRADQMAPPAEPCECYCLHCGRTFSSDRIWFQRVVGARDGFDGFWMCPTPNCGGAGFTFDIFPTDPDHPANAGWTYTDDDDEGADWDDDADASGDGAGEADEYDPDEPQYKELDALHGDGADGVIDDEDLEGEEWKYGLQPGQRPGFDPTAEVPGYPPPNDEGRREWEEQQRKYDMPDERPRELDWTHKEEEERRDRPITDDDIPF